MPSSPIKILLVEDEHIIADDLADMLEEAGYVIAGIAATGEAAMRLFRDTAPDVVLMDVHLQGDMDGITLAEKMNAIRRMPIIYLTAQGDAASIARAKATQPAAYLLKPFDEHGLLISIDIAVNNFVVARPAPHPIAEQQATAAQFQVAKDRFHTETILCVNDILFIKQNYKFVKLHRNDLLFIEADGNHSSLHTTTGKLVFRQSLTQMIEKLADNQLVRVHRSFAVRRPAIESFTDSEIMVSQRNIPIGDAYRETFFQGFSLL